MKTIVEVIKENNALPRGRIKLDTGHEYEVEVTQTVRGAHVAALNEYVNNIREHVVAFEYGDTKAEALYNLTKKLLN